MDEETERIKEEMRKEVQKELDTINHALAKVIKTLDEVELCMKKILDKL